MRYLYLFLPKMTVIIVLAIITVLTSCHKADIQDGTILDEIAEYRSFYEEQLLKNGTKSHSNMPRRNPVWGKATIKNWRRGYAAVTPLDYDGDYFIRTSTSSYYMNLGAASFLMINKTRDGSMQGEIVYLIPDGLASRSEKGGKSRFSGTIVVVNLQGGFLAAYALQTDGSVLRYGNTSTTASLKNANSTNGFNCFIYEIWQKTSIDGGQTWSDPTLISSRMECYYFPDDNEVFYDYVDLGGGGGGGGGVGGSDIITSVSSRPLTSEENQKLDEVRLMISVDCATNKVIDAVWNGLIFNVKESISNPAIYSPDSNTITFSNSSSINTNNILEELFHAYQNTIYAGGIAQYADLKPGNTNIEFEAKLFKDIYAASYGGGWSGNIGFPDSIRNKYNAWVWDIAMEGFTPMLMEQYSTMLGYFNQYNSFYGGYLLPGLASPLAIIQSRNGCN